MNTVYDYDVCIRYYCRMSLQLTKKVLNMDIHLKSWEKNVLEIMDPLYNRDKIFEKSIMYREIEHGENDDINHWG